MLLPLGRCSTRQVARSLGLTERTLHRRLAAEGESFSSIVHAHPGGAGRAVPRGRPVLADRGLGAARLHRAQRLLAVVPPAVRDEPHAVAERLTVRPGVGT